MPPALSSPLFCAVAVAMLLVPLDPLFLNFGTLAYIVIVTASKPKWNLRLSIEKNISLAKSHTVFFFSGLLCTLVLCIYAIRVMIVVWW